jgi:Ca-activated chloride channel homolog
MRYSASVRIFSVVTLSLLLAVSTIIPAGAYQQSPKPQAPQPPQQTPPKQEKKDKAKKDQRQGATVDNQPTGEDIGRVVVDTDLVQLDVKVIDQANRPIYDMKKDDFAVYEDKIQQNVEMVSREEVPLSFGLVIDSSGSMRTKLPTVSEAATGLIKEMRTDDEAFIAQFKDEAELVQEFSRDKSELDEAISQIYTGGRTALLDAIIATADYTQEKARNRRKALVVFTDGLERDSAVKEQQVMAAMKEDEVQVYLVGFIDEEESKGGIFGKSSGKKAKDLLIRLAEDSGGRAFFPKDLSEMPAIAAQIAKDLRSQYVLSYYPSNDKRDGSFRNVRVVVNPKDSRKLIARTRQGYYAKKEGESAQPTPPRKLTGKNPE